MKQTNDSLLNTRKFIPLFGILFLNASSDNLLRSAILVMITFNGVGFAGLNDALEVNLATLLFMLPFFILSSYAGKFADCYNKITIIKIVKYCELLIVALASWGLIKQNAIVIYCALFAMGTHSTFFGPIKYSILPEYIKDRRKLLLASGYVEAGTFVAVLVGQTIGSWNMAEHRLDIVLMLLIFSALIGLVTTYRLEAIVPHSQKIYFDRNIFKDTYNTYKQVMANPEVRINLRSISWFWAVGAFINTQLPIFTRGYMGGNAYVFSVILALFSISIGVGSLVCAIISRGKIVRYYVLFGAGLISCLSLALLLVNCVPKDSIGGVTSFLSNWQGWVNYLIIIGIGFFGGFYSVTCYNELQVIAPSGTLSRIVAVNNLLNASYMVATSIACTLLLLIISLWWLFVIFVVANTLFVYWYWQNCIKSQRLNKLI